MKSFHRVGKPTISIILPIRNEENAIRGCLEAIINQDFSLDQIEVLIADGMSIDTTRRIVKQYQDLYPQISLVDNPSKIVSTGMNRAIRISRGDFIFRVDGHTILSPKYIKTCHETLMRTNADNVGGGMSASGNTIFGTAISIATSVPFGIGNSKFHYSNLEEEVDTVYMGAWPIDVFRRIGLFDEELVRDQDDEFNYRIRENGGKIILNPKIKSVYYTRSSPLSLWKQYFQYGFYKVRVLQKHPRQMSVRQFVPPVFVLSLLLAILLTVILPWGWVLLAMITGSYLTANLAASLVTAAQKGWKHLWLLPVTFAILHLSYGLGFLCGLVKFWNRWGDKIGKVPEWIKNE